MSDLKGLSYLGLSPAGHQSAVTRNCRVSQLRRRMIPWKAALNSATATVTRMFGCVAHICCYTSKATTPTLGCSEFLCDCGMTGMCRLHGNWHQMEFNRFTGYFHLTSTLSSVFTVVSSLNIFKLIENDSSAREPMRFSLSPSNALIGLDWVNI